MSLHDNMDPWDEIDHLRAWKAEAMQVLSEWDDVWEAMGRPGPLGASKASNVRAQVYRNQPVIEAALDFWAFGTEEARFALHDAIDASGLARPSTPDEANEAQS